MPIFPKKTTIYTWLMIMKSPPLVLCITLLLLGLDGALAYSIKDATPLGGAKSSEAEGETNFVRKEEEDQTQTEDIFKRTTSATDEKKALMEDMAQVLAEQQYEMAKQQASHQAADKAALEAMPSEEKLREAFELFDQDGNGAIDHQDLRAVMNAFGKKVMLHDVGDRLHNDVLDDLLSAADLDTDGQVTFKDYSGFLLELAHHKNFASSMKKGHSVPILSILSDFEAHMGSMVET